MYAPTFLCEDDKTQFEGKVRLIAEEELKEIKRKELYGGIKRKIDYLRLHPETNSLLKARDQEQNDDDYQMDVDTELSL